MNKENKQEDSKIDMYKYLEKAQKLQKRYCSDTSIWIQADSSHRELKSVSVAAFYLNGLKSKVFHFNDFVLEEELDELLVELETFITENI